MNLRGYFVLQTSRLNQVSPRYYIKMLSNIHVSLFGHFACALRSCYLFFLQKTERPQDIAVPSLLNDRWFSKLKGTMRNNVDKGYIVNFRYKMASLLKLSRLKRQRPSLTLLEFFSRKNGRRPYQLLHSSLSTPTAGF